jgi:hypothetical protein
MNDKVTHSACPRLAQSVRQGTAMAHLMSRRSNESVPCIHVCTGAMQLLRAYNLYKVSRITFSLTPIAFFPTNLTLINASHIGVIYPEYCGLWLSNLLIQVSVPATYCCKKTVSELVPTWHPSWQFTKWRVPLHYDHTGSQMQLLLLLQIF